MSSAKIVKGIGKMADGLISIHRPDDQATATSWLLLALVVIIGAALRFWGLGNIGLHGDEDVMGLATRGILETGSPILPSGMYYPRALPQLYLMAMSIHFFGDTEWALRLPSVLVGALGIIIAFWLGRRFLSVRWSIVFALVVAVLPIMISLSQTARMYGFYATFVMLFAVTIFRWERTGSIVDYLISIAACLAAVSFHTLTVFSMLLFFYPGAIRWSWRLLLLGGVAFAVCFVASQELGEWIGSNYFTLVELPSNDDGMLLDEGQTGLNAYFASWGILMVVLVASITYVLARRRQFTVNAAIWNSSSVACLTGAIVFALLAQFHVAGLAFALGTLLGIRAGLRVTILVSIGTILTIILALQAYLIWQSGEVDGLNDLVLTLIGIPSAWAYVIFFRFAPAAVIIYGIVAANFAFRFTKGEALPDHALFFLVAVFAPLFVIGFFSGYIPGRYIVGFLPFFVLAVIAGIKEIFDEYAGSQALKSLPGLSIMTAVLLIVFAKPSEFWYNVNPRYSDFRNLSDHRGVDHKGAAEFVLAQGLGPDDLVIVVDAQQQSYYLGNRIDFYMRSLNNSRNSSFTRNGKMLNLYAGTPQISSGEKLADVFRNQKHGQVLIVGSGELEKNLERYMGDRILETMRDFRVEEVYEGRDGATKVWRYLPSDLSIETHAK